MDSRELEIAQLIGFVSHDLKNPLASVLMALQILMRKARLHPDDAKVVARALSSAERMNRIVHQLLDYTRIRTEGGVPLDRRVVSLNAVCRRVVDELEIAHGRVRIVLTERDAVSGSFDEDRLGEILSNVIGNACQYSEPGSDVQIAIARDDHHVEVTVLNHGEPIPDELLPIVFEAFRGNRSGTRSTGLGLFICRQLVQAHGGTISVTSSREEGTRFTIRLPVL